MSNTQAHKDTLNAINLHLTAFKTAMEQEGLRVNSIHLAPANTATQGSGGQCHPVQLPNGHWTIVCD
jgi:hypothetical protein